jgi:hypothetical protein
MAREPLQRSDRPFSALLWSLFALIFLYLFAWPLAQGALASRTWEKVPCHVATDAAGPTGRPAPVTRYFFTHAGIPYYSSRISFWQLQNTEPLRAAQAPPDAPPSTFCYLRARSDGTVSMAVLKPLAPPSAAILASRATITAALLATILSLLWRINRTEKSPPSAPEISQSSPPAAGGAR